MLSGVGNAPAGYHLPDGQNSEVGAAGVLMGRVNFYEWAMRQIDDGELLQLHFGCVIRTNQVPRTDNRLYDAHQWLDVWDHLQNQQLVWQENASGFTPRPQLPPSYTAT